MSKKILLVEDEALIAMSEAKMLEKHGFEVVSVYNGEKAIVAVDADPAISLILMDIDLGKGMDGTEAAEEILDRHDIPIVFLTSHAEKEYVDKVKTITGSGYILKNSGEFVLIESIDMALNLFEAKQEALHHLRETELRESRLNHLNRLLLSVRNVNQIITKETDIHELLDKTCRLLIETSGYKRAWIVLLRDEKPEEPYFHAGFSGTFGPMTDFLNSGQIPVCAEAALQSGAIRALVQNTTRCGNCPFRRRELSKACAETEENVLTAKLEYAGKLQGWISVLVPKMYAHNRDDQHLFEEIAMDVSYALQSIGAHRETVETKKLLESVMNAIPDAIGVLEGNFNVIRYNSAGYQLLGKTAAEVDGQKCYELINRAAPCEICAVKKSYATKNIEQFEIYEADLNKWIDLRAYPILDDHGNVVKIIEHFRDITEGKQAEDALRENSKTAHQFFSESAAGAFFMMLDEPIEWNDSVDKEKVLDYVFDHQRISQINKAMLDQYLAREEEFLGKTPKQLFAHDVEHGRSLWWKMFDQGFLSIDSNERRFDGSRLWIVGSYRCMYDEQGRITGHFGTQHDITKLKQAQEKLRMKSSFIDRIAEVSPDIFIIYKRDGEYLDIITTNENNLFLKREEMLGSKIPEVLPETAAATILQGIDDALTTNSLKVVEYELGIDNEILDFEARITPLEEDRVLAHIIDITERKQLEDQLKKSEERFKTIFYNSEVSLWEEDFSEVEK